MSTYAKSVFLLILLLSEMIAVSSEKTTAAMLFEVKMPIFLSDVSIEKKQSADNEDESGDPSKRTKRRDARAQMRKKKKEKKHSDDDKEEVSRKEKQKKRHKEYGKL